MATKKRSAKNKSLRNKSSSKGKAPAKKGAKAIKKKTASKAKARKNIKPKTKIKSKKKTKIKPKAKTKIKSKKKTKIKPKAKTQTKSKTKTKTATKNHQTNIKKPKKVKLDPVTTKIRERLVRNQQELLNIIQLNQAVERNTTESNFSNEIDMASSMEGREMMFQLTSRDRNELKMIQEAVYKIDHGTYGICDVCSNKISTKRLKILPLSSLCIECKEAMEHA